ncbi:stigma-specific STIG1-like protein 1 [Actinidia eriantha]|uniref:stigma-specific STIG1-like protein 1 n=1 Tax=Actinidia eriantha TaxID=165200 RepID=UPI00258ABB9A|nr:stigma-specific STIG1-like protein 1 [Actinidia eriantha]
MKCIKILLMSAMLMAFIVTLSATSEDEELFPYDDENYETTETYDYLLHESQEQTSLRGANRLLAQRTSATMTCNKYPRLCRAKGSPGPDCCKKRCVNVMTDRLNCGQCGNKCKYTEICCKGQCVNPRNNKRHCGGCDNKCKKGSMCVYGMCSYA